MISLALGLLVIAQQPVRQTRTIEGWTVNIRIELLQKDKELTDKAIRFMTDQLRQIKKVVPKSAVIELQKVQLWMSPEYPGIVPRAEYHPGAQWLRDNGRDPAMVHGIEFTNIRIFEAEVKRMPIFVLHELAHAYHDQVLGFDNQQIQSAYDHAKTSGKYDHVERNDGKFLKAYAMTNSQEYFAEGTEAYFGKNDFFPFERRDLKSIDPELFGIMEKVWLNPKSKN